MKEQKTIGRPKYTDQVKRRNRVILTLTDDELQTVQRLAKATHLTVPAMIVHSAFRTMRLHYPDVMPEILEETKFKITFASDEVAP